MQLTAGKCKGCSEKAPIVNKKYELCNDCNYKRLHPDENETQNKAIKMAEMMRKKVENYNKRKLISPIYKRPNQVSVKQRVKEKQIKEVYKEMDRDSEPICSGCGSGSYPLSHSHIIPRSRRKDLEADPRNIVYDCLQIGEHISCHDKWSGSLKEKKTLLNYNERMEYIQEMDYEYFILLTE